MRGCLTRRRATRPPTFAMLAVVCAVGLGLWWAAWRVGMWFGRWAGWLG